MNNVNFAGGHVLVKRGSIDGWEVTHVPEGGGEYAVTWSRHKSAAVQAGQYRAQNFNARLFVEASQARSA